MPKQDYIIPIIKGGGKMGVKSYVNLRTKQFAMTGHWSETPNCLVSEYCQKVETEALAAYEESWDRIFGRKNG